MKNKDPAVLWYTSDFLTGVSDLTMEERGQYITLLCMQHQKGHLSEKTICLTVGNVSVDVMKKFQKDEDGLYYQHRMDEEIEKRSNYIDSRVENGKKGGRPKTICKPYAKPYGKAKQNHTENENENENISKNTDTKKHKYGTYENVLLSDEHYQKLINEFPYDYQERIERLSEYIASKGAKYKDHLATIRSWARKESPKTNILDEIIREGMRSESNGNGKNNEADPVTVPRLL